MDRLRRQFRRVSLRTKLVALMAALMMAGILATAWATAQSTRAALVGQIDVDLRASYSDLGTALQVAVAEEQPVPLTGGRTSDFYAGLYDVDGKLLESKAAYGNSGDGPALPTVTPQMVSDHKRAPFTVRGTEVGSRGWRVLAVQASGQDGSVVVALPLANTVENVERATASILLAGTLATMVMSLIGYAVTTRAFRPLRRVERTAASIAQGDLSGRIEEYPIETEVGRLSYSLNAMLAQIEAAFRSKAASEQKMRRFIQDASHELRTPLVTIRGYSELYRHGGIPAGEPLDQSMGRIESEAKRMTQLVEDLLTLARLDEERPLEPAPVDLLVLANDAVSDTRVNAPDRVIRLVGVDGNPPTSAPTMGDEAKLRQVVVNLMTNALRYTPEGTPIEVAVGVRPVMSGRSDSVIAIVDHGEGIPPADAQRIFERFYRADSSRQRETGGTGLGLAIVAAIAKQHDGGIRLSDTEGGGATMSLHVPYVALDPVDDAEPSELGEAESSAPSTSALALLRSTFARKGPKDTGKDAVAADEASTPSDDAWPAGREAQGATGSAEDDGPGPRGDAHDPGRGSKGSSVTGPLMRVLRQGRDRVVRTGPDGGRRGLRRGHEPDDERGKEAGTGGEHPSEEGAPGPE